MLGALGPRIDSLRVHLGKTHPDDHEPHGWRRWAGGVARRPWGSMIAAAAVLIVLAVPALNLHLGQNDVGAMSEDTTARQAYDLISEGFGPGQNGPLLVATKLGTPAKNDQSQLDDLNKQAQQQQAAVEAGQADAAEPVRPAEAGRPEEVPRVAGQRPAAADAQERHREDPGRQVGVRAGARQEGRHRRS